MTTKSAIAYANSRLKKAIKSPKKGRKQRNNKKAQPPPPPKPPTPKPTPTMPPTPPATPLEPVHIPDPVKMAKIMKHMNAPLNFPPYGERLHILHVRRSIILRILSHLSLRSLQILNRVHPAFFNLLHTRALDNVFFRAPLGEISTRTDKDSYVNFTHINPVFGALIWPGADIGMSNIRLRSTGCKILLCKDVLDGWATRPSSDYVEIRILCKTPKMADKNGKLLEGPMRIWDKTIKIEDSKGVTVRVLLKAVTKFLMSQSSPPQTFAQYHRCPAHLQSFGAQRVMNNFDFTDLRASFPRKWYIDPSRPHRIICNYDEWTRTTPGLLEKERALWETQMDVMTAGMAVRIEEVPEEGGKMAGGYWDEWSSYLMPSTEMGIGRSRWSGEEGWWGEGRGI